MPIRLPQGNFAISDLICARITFNGDGSVISGLDPFTPRRIVLPQVNEPLTPTLGFGDGDSGFFESSDDVLRVSLAGVDRWTWTGGDFQGRIGAGSALIRNRVATATVPVLTIQGDSNTGIGHSAADQLSLIAGGVRVANLTEAAGVVQFIVPLQNNAANPSIAFGDGDTGFFESADDTLRISLIGAQQFLWSGVTYGGTLSNAGAMLNEASTATNPTLLPDRADQDTGIGHRTDDICVLIAGAQNCMEFGEAGAAPLVAFYGTAAIALQTGVAVSSAGIHAALVNLGLITA